jgi:hypothetical protein
MKSFKKIETLIICISMLVAMSCKDNSLNEVSNTDPSYNNSFAKTKGVNVLVSALPQPTKDFVASNYSGIAIVHSSQFPKGYEVKLSDNTKLDFTLNGTFIAVASKSKPSDNVPVTLPEAILAYITKNYPSETILKAEKGLNKYEVTLSNFIKLEFNLDGTFREVSGKVKPANISDLPKAVLDYLAKNYASLKIVKVEFCSKKIEVKLSDGVKLEFNLDGTFREVSGKMTGVGTDLPSNGLPAAITTYIATKYPGQTITKAEKGAKKYEVTLSNGIKLEFNLDGSFSEISGKKKGK